MLNARKRKYHVWYFCLSAYTNTFMRSNPESDKSQNRPRIVMINSLLRDSTEMPQGLEAVAQTSGLLQNGLATCVKQESLMLAL